MFCTLFVTLKAVNISVMLQNTGSHPLIYISETYFSGLSLASKHALLYFKSYLNILPLWSCLKCCLLSRNLGREEEGVLELGLKNVCSQMSQDKWTLREYHYYKDYKGLDLSGGRVMELGL